MIIGKVKGFRGSMEMEEQGVTIRFEKRDVEDRIEMGKVGRNVKLIRG